MLFLETIFEYLIPIIILSNILFFIFSIIFVINLITVLVYGFNCMFTFSSIGNESTFDRREKKEAKELIESKNNKKKLIYVGCSFFTMVFIEQITSYCNKLFVMCYGTDFFKEIFDKLLALYK